MAKGTKRGRVRDKWKDKKWIIVNAPAAFGGNPINYVPITDIENSKVCAIISGGNIDVTMLSLIIEKGLVKSFRKMNLIVTLMDKPGSLMHLTEVFTQSMANIVQIDYDRNSVKLEFGEAHVTIALETKGEEHQKLIRENLKQNGYRFKQI